MMSDLAPVFTPPGSLHTGFLLSHMSWVWSETRIDSEFVAASIFPVPPSQFYFFPGNRSHCLLSGFGDQYFPIHWLGGNVIYTQPYAQMARLWSEVFFLPHLPPKHSINYSGVNYQALENRVSGGYSSVFVPRRNETFEMIFSLISPPLLSWKRVLSLREVSVRKITLLLSLALVGVRAKEIVSNLINGQDREEMQIRYNSPIWPGHSCQFLRS